MARRTTVTAATRRCLIEAAERLFAERGLDGVSLRRINRAAGQRNASASHYHFGSKAALVAAILEHRMRGVNGRRLARLEALEAEGRAADPHALVEALVYPLAETLDASGGHYLEFLAQVIGHPRGSLAEIGAGPQGESVQRTARALRAALPELPDAIFGQRFLLAVSQTVHALADRARRSRAPGGGAPPAALFVSNLVDHLTGALAAPVSPETRRELRRGARARA